MFLGSSLFLPCSALTANLCFSWWNGNLHLGWVDELQDWLSPLVCTRATFPFVSDSAIWAFLPISSDYCWRLWALVLFGHSCLLVLMCVWCWELFETWGGIWAFCQLVLTCVWSWGSFMSTDCYLVIFCQLVLMSGYSWGLCVSTECHLGILPIGSNIWLTLRTVCVGEVFGILYWSPLEKVYNRAYVWCIGVYSICMTGNLVALRKMGNPGSIH